MSLEKILHLSLVIQLILLKAKECDNELKSQYNINPDILTWGIGAGFYKDLERDTLGWSMKTCFSNGRDTMKYRR